MKQKKRLFNPPYGLRARFAILLIFAALLCSLVFFGLYTASDYYLTRHFDTPEYLDSQMEQQGKSLQEFVDENEISSQDLSQLKNWENKQPTVLLEMYADGQRIYSSFDEMRKRARPDEQRRNDERDEQRGFSEHDEQLRDDERAIVIHLTDRDVQVLLFSDVPYQYYVIATSLSALVAITLFFIILQLGNRKLIRYVCRLNEEVQIIEGGNLDYQVSVEGNDEITDLAKSMNRMSASFRQQLASENALHRANKRLVTEMSHDLRTPLTGMMLYLEILRSHQYRTEEELQEYLEKINAKAQHLKQISDHLFAYSLKESPEQCELKTMEQTFSAAVAAFTDELQENGFRVVSDVTWSPCYVQVNGEYLQRIHENVVSNLYKYADPSAEIMINTIDTEEFCGFSIMNACAALDTPPESSGVGIESIRSMMQQMDGQCTVEETENAFEITLLFPKR